MKKILLKINNQEDLKYKVDGFILGLDKYSVCFGETFNIDLIRKIKEDNNDKEIFVSLNRVIFNDEIDDYKNILHELDLIGLNGIIIGDLAALTYNLNTNIILDQLHLNNSYLTCNHYYNNGASGILVNDDITYNEINDIKDNTNALLFKKVFGYSVLSMSRRKLISNYREYFNTQNKDSVCLINENNSDNYYPIIEDDFGTYILSDKPINLLEYNNLINVDYVIIDNYLIDKDISMVIDSYLNNDISKANEIESEFNTNTGFINKKTIFKVKNNE